MNKPALGTGERFANLKKSLARKKGIYDPAALAASIGRKKYGVKRYAGLASAGKKKEVQRYA